MIGAWAERRQKTTGDDCRESVFHSARHVFVTMASKSKPIFCNEEDKLPSLSLCFWVTTPHPTPRCQKLLFFLRDLLFIYGLQIVVFVMWRKRSIGLNTGPLWDIGGVWIQHQLNHKLTCVYLCVRRSINDYRALVDYHAHESPQRQSLRVDILTPKQTSQSYILQKVQQLQKENCLIWSDSDTNLRAAWFVRLSVCQGPPINQSVFLGSLSSSRLWLHA